MQWLGILERLLALLRNVVFGRRTARAVVTRNANDLKSNGSVLDLGTLWDNELPLK